ncbi:MAG TPA: hypothetical protein VIP05_27615 [Burkholderiaceae bacterium]
MLLPVERQLRDDLDGWIDANAEPFCPGASPRTIAWLAAMVQGASRQAIVAFQHEIAHADFRAEFARVDVPVTIIQGTSTSPHRRRCAASAWPRSGPTPSASRGRAWPRADGDARAAAGGRDRGAR